MWITNAHPSYDVSLILSFNSCSGSMSQKLSGAIEMKKKTIRKSIKMIHERIKNIFLQTIFMYNKTIKYYPRCMPSGCTA